MATVTTTSLSGQYQKYFQPEMLKYAQFNTRLIDFGMPANLPKNKGAKQVSWFRYDVPDDANVQTLSEGTIINTFRDLTLTEVNKSLTQYGESVKLTDILSMTDLYNASEQAVKILGQDAALKADSICRNEIAGAAGATERFAQGISSWANLAAANAAASFVDAQDVLDAVTNLKVNRAPMRSDGTVMVTCPQVARDLLRDTDFLEAAKYSNVSALYKGEAGSLYGVRIVVQDNPFREYVGGAQYTYAGTGAIYTSIILGDQGFGVVPISGDSPASPQLVIVDKADHADPINQTKLVSYKLYYAAKLLNGSFVVTLRSKTRWV